MLAVMLGFGDSLPGWVVSVSGLGFFDCDWVESSPFCGRIDCLPVLSSRTTIPMSVVVGSMSGWRRVGFGDSLPGS